MVLNITEATIYQKMMGEFNKTLNRKLTEKEKEFLKWLSTKG